MGHLCHVLVCDIVHDFLGLSVEHPDYIFFVDGFARHLILVLIVLVLACVLMIFVVILMISMITFQLLFLLSLFLNKFHLQVLNKIIYT